MNLKHIFNNSGTIELTVEQEDYMKKIDFEINNTFGEMISTGSFFEKIIVPTTSFTPGIYLIKLKSGKTFAFKKIIKE